MNQLPIYQTFFDKPVRFFKADFEVEMRCRYDTPSLGQKTTEMNHHYDDPMHCRNDNASSKKTIEMRYYNNTPSTQKFTFTTWAIPLPDYATVIGYPPPVIRQMIRLNKDVFRPFYRIELIPDALGRLQKTVLMAQAMCDMLTAKLHTSRIKDPQTRENIINFQQQLIITFELIRRGELRPARFLHGKEIPPEYLRILSLPPGRETRKAVDVLAEQEGRSTQQIYRRFQKVRGSNAITHEGKPRRQRFDAGTHKKQAEYEQTIEYKKTYPNAGPVTIRAALGLKTHKDTIKKWIKGMGHRF